MVFHPLVNTLKSSLYIAVLYISACASTHYILRFGHFYVGALGRVCKPEKSVRIKEETAAAALFVVGYLFDFAPVAQRIEQVVSTH